jgi:hypothetical protein
MVGGYSAMGRQTDPLPAPYSNRPRRLTVPTMEHVLTIGRWPTREVTQCREDHPFDSDDVGVKHSMPLVMGVRLDRTQRPASALLTGKPSRPKRLATS